MASSTPPQLHWTWITNHVWIALIVLLSLSDAVTVTKNEGVFMATTSPDYIGYALKEGSTYLYGYTGMWIMHKLELPQGYLRKFLFYVWKYNRQHLSTVYLQIWRPNTLPLDSSVESQLKLVWQVGVEVNYFTNGSLYTVTMDMHEWFLVGKGDVIGWTTSDGFMPFACEESSERAIYFSQSSNLPVLNSSHTFLPEYGFNHKCSVGVQIRRVTITSGPTIRTTTRPTPYIYRQTTAYQPGGQQPGMPSSTLPTTTTTEQTTPTTTTTTTTKPTTTTTKPTTKSTTTKRTTPTTTPTPPTKKSTTPTTTTTTTTTEATTTKTTTKTITPRRPITPVPGTPQPPESTTQSMIIATITDPTHPQLSTSRKGDDSSNTETNVILPSMPSIDLSVSGRDLTIIIVSTVTVFGVVVVIVAIVCACYCRHKSKVETTSLPEMKAMAQKPNIYDPKPDLVLPLKETPSDHYLTPVGKMSLVPDGVLPPQHTIPAGGGILHQGAPPVLRDHPGRFQHNQDQEPYNSLHDSDFDDDEEYEEYERQNNGVKPTEEYYNTSESQYEEIVGDDAENPEQPSYVNSTETGDKLTYVNSTENGDKPKEKEVPPTVRRMIALLNHIEDDFKPKKAEKLVLPARAIWK